MDRSLCIAEAVAIAEQLRERSTRSFGGCLNWIGPSGYGTELIPLRTVELGPNLYDGTTGIALFFAALGRLHGRDEYRGLALQILAPLRRKLAALVAAPDRAVRLRSPVGGLMGLGSFLYGLLRAGELLNEPSLIHEAHAATVLITPERIACDRHVRIQTGCAGAILTLLAIHAKLPGPNVMGKTPLDTACECAWHLLDVRISFEGRPLAWPLSPGKPPLGGFSYGAAGISYALLRAYEATGSQILMDVAQEGLDFVRTLYSPEHGFWRDIRLIFQSRYQPRLGTWRDWWASGTLDDLEEVPGASSADYFPMMWCHGAVGIALGRIGALPVNDVTEARQEIDGVLKKVKYYAREAETLNGPDDLCCGHMGYLELLLCANQKLGDTDASAAALCLMERVRSRAESRGGYELSAARGEDIFAPSLFQGIAGIGYSFLRLAAPEEIPCVLLLE